MNVNRGKAKKRGPSCNGSNRVDLHERVVYLNKITYTTTKLKPIWGQLGMFKHWVQLVDKICLLSNGGGMGVGFSRSTTFKVN
jgi:hypothetical protein